MNYSLQRALERVAKRLRRLRLWSTVGLCWYVWAILGAGLVAILARPVPAILPDRWLLGSYLGLAVATALACAALALRSARDPRSIARRIEARYPELKTGLLAAVEEDAAAATGELGYLQTAVIQHALHHRLSHDWDHAVSARSLRSAKLAHLMSLGLLLVVCFTLVSQTRVREQKGIANGVQASSAHLDVDPGDTSIERGTPLLIVARFAGPVPTEAHLLVEGHAQPTARKTMTRSLEDPTFAGRIESVESDLSYRVEFAGQRSRAFRVTVFEYPEVLRTDAKLVFPEYTSLQPKTVEDIRHVTAVEGTEVTLLCHINKPVRSARLVDEKGRPVELQPEQGESQLYRATMTLSDPRRLKVQLIDREGRSNKLPTQLVINVTRNRPAVVKMTQPAHDVRVSPVEELTLKAQLDDDFGIVRHGLSYTLAGREPKDVVLSGAEQASRHIKAEHLLDFESMSALPDELVSYHFWAEDLGPDGKPRRSSGDMFFAEVRHFEEIFRQGEQPPAGSADMEGGGNAQEAMQLAELEKQIVSGTWNLLRRETAAQPSEKFKPDSQTLLESQQSAIEQAGQLAEKLRDQASKASLNQATRFMKDAETRLKEAAGSARVAALTPALAAEQAAYQALLKLRDREFNIVRANRQQRGGRGSAGGPSQRQLQQLELSDEENRYEQQRSARAPQDKREQEQRENRQVLSRLRELAQRQADLNDRIKELQSALEAEQDKQARAELQRQLKRLREQEQQILRDTDELRERMEREENRDRMADAREQAEQGREHVRQASDALEQGRLSQALTEGTRAGRQLNDLREEMRKNAANRFSEEMTELRNQARRLDERQTKLTEQLEANRDEAQHSLRDDPERQQVRQGLQEQEKQLEGVLDRMKNTVQDAEENEPLLAKELFDTVRKANEDQIPDALKTAERLAELGIAAEATKASQHAGKGLEAMRQGVERAARSVLGDETAALRRAQEELEELADQVDREIAQATGQDAEKSARDSSPAAAPKGDRAQRAQRKDGQPQNGQRPGEPDPQGQTGQQGDQPGQQDAQGKGLGGQRGQGDQRGGRQPQLGQRGPGSLRGQPADGQEQAAGGNNRQAGIDQLTDGLTRSGGPGGPITGGRFREWSDRMRDVEELLDDPQLRSETARIRDRARGAREDFKRHAKMPDWNQLRTLVANPIRELRDRVAEEVRKRQSPDDLVPIDRDPVPPQFAEGVRRYYERLGSGR